jgi:FkbM family methyltransferase
VCICLDGHRVYAATLDRIIALWMRRFTSAERFETALWKQLIAPGMIVADVGANLGVYSLQAAAAAGPRGRVHAFEPEPENFALLQRNIAANAYANITAHRAAVADTAGTLTLYVRPEHRGDHRIYDTNGAGRFRVEVPAVTLDAIFADQPPPDVIKFDIQGAEARAADGMGDILASGRPLCIITEFWPEGLAACGAEPGAFLARWREAGFTLQNIDDAQKRLESLDDEELLALCRRIRYTNLLLTRGR